MIQQQQWNIRDMIIEANNIFQHYKHMTKKDGTRIYSTVKKAWIALLIKIAITQVNTVAKL